MQGRGARVVDISNQNILFKRRPSYFQQRVETNTSAFNARGQPDVLNPRHRRRLLVLHLGVQSEGGVVELGLLGGEKRPKSDEESGI